MDKAQCKWPWMFKKLLLQFWDAIMWCKYAPIKATWRLQPQSCHSPSYNQIANQQQDFCLIIAWRVMFGLWIMLDFTLIDEEYKCCYHLQTGHSSHTVARSHPTMLCPWQVPGLSGTHAGTRGHIHFLCQVQLSYCATLCSSLLLSPKALGIGRLLFLFA